MFGKINIYFTEYLLYQSLLYIDSHGTKTVQLPSLRQRVQSSWELEEAPDGTHWEKVAQVPAVRQSFQF